MKYWFFMLFFLAACTDYVEQIDDQLAEFDAHRQAQSISFILTADIQVNPADVVEGKFTDKRDGRTYKTVAIGLQTWMAENLNYKVADSYCYNGKDSNCATYGRLYTWAAAMDSAGLSSSSAKDCGKGKICAPTYPVRGVCPEGWHLPTYGEWETLLTAADSNKYLEGPYRLMSKVGWGENGNGSDDYGFSMYPAGARTDKGKYFYEGSRAYFWTSTENAKNDAYRFHVDLEKTSNLYSEDKSYGLSIRCVSNTANKVKTSSQVPDSSSSKPSYGTLMDYRNGMEYKTIAIGSQIWMAKNLNYKMDSSSCYYDKEANCDKYGRLYSWDAAMKACPIGWHLPSKKEFNTLINATETDSMAGTSLKSTSGWNKNDVLGGKDSYGFSALPSGFSIDGKFMGEGTNSYFWSSTIDKNNDDTPYQLALNQNDNKARLSSDKDKNSRLSVRCIKGRSSGESVPSERKVDSVFMWNAADDMSGRVFTGAKDGDSSDYWYDYDDSVEGGSSVMMYPADVETNESNDFFGPLAKAYGGLKGTVSFGEGYEFPYAGLAFNVTGAKRKGTDIMEWDGICLSYRSTINFSIELVVEDEAFATEYTNNYSVTVTKSENLRSVDFPWAKFTQAPTKTSPKNLEEVLFKTAVVRLNFEGKAGTSGDFFIQAIGSLGQCPQAR